MTDAQLQQWSELVESRTGLQIGERQKSHLHTQINIRMRELGESNYDNYFNRVVSGLDGMMEWAILVDRLMVNETQFFRHRPSFELVRRIVQHRIDNQILDDSFDVWSVGCSSGEEVYSLAAILYDCFTLANLKHYFSVNGMDLSASALATARSARYSDRRVSMLSIDERNRYLVKEDDDQNSIRSEIRDRVTFTRGNVLALEEMPLIKMDVIFCQNILIYFRRWRRRQILNEFARRLKPGGVVIIGLGELVDWQHPQIESLSVDGVQAYRLLGGTSPGGRSNKRSTARATI
ncbi:methyltransferase PilK [Marinibactrum halimedae]|uniref:protein-glutamate O-methyltransferase n=2 Tax=Marinibactrum halimedae TaxID=1444977 RepID=A0AA37T8R6_9GAMM|nr:CheR family methyltransferase [Marinibactrum halimedae]GLS27043.1 methyltransferase PilK [Marinibactrum halimedae]